LKVQTLRTPHNHDLSGKSRPKTGAPAVAKAIIEKIKAATLIRIELRSKFTLMRICRLFPARL